MRVRFLFLIAAACVFTCPALADTTWVAGGGVSGNWTSEGSPYIILGDIHVPTTQMLQIGPGVTVFFAVRCSLFVDSAARLEALGAEGDSIYFTTDTLAQPERWGGIEIDSDADTCRFEWCVIENAVAYGINAWGAPLRVHASALRYNRAGGEAGAILHANNYLELTNCIFQLNSASHGGAMLLSMSEGRIEDCVFRNNNGGSLGGAIDWFAQLEPLMVRGCDFMYNYATHGGAVALEVTDTSLVFENCRFMNNGAAETGGAVSSYVAGGSAQFLGCLFDTNIAVSEGGGLYLRSASVVDRCVFVGNLAQSGGAIYFDYVGSTYPVIRRSTFYHQLASIEGAAIYLEDWASIQACAFVNCLQSAALQVPPNGQPPTPRWPQYNLFFDNTDGDFSFNNAGLGGICCTNRNSDSCDAYYNIMLDPEFVDGENGDFHLLPTSPCIDAGPDSSYMFRFRDPDGTIADIGAFYYDQSTKANDLERTAVRHYELAQNYPNPFNAVTRIEFDLPRAGNVELNVFDITGRRVAELIHAPLSAGHHTADFDAACLPSGVYLYRLHTNESVPTKKMILLK